MLMKSQIIRALGCTAISIGVLFSLCRTSILAQPDKQLSANRPPQSGDLLTSIVMSPLQTDKYCGFDQVTLSPSGREIAIWSQTAEEPSRFGSFSLPSSVGLAPIACFFGRAQCQGIWFNSLAPLPSPMWSSDDQSLFIADSRLGLTEFVRLEDGNHFRLGKIWPLSKGIAGSLLFRGAAAKGGQEIAAEIEGTRNRALSLKGANYVVRSMSVGPEGVRGIVLEDKTDLSAILAQNSNMWLFTLPEKTPQLDFVSAIKTNGNIGVSGIGYLSEVRNGTAVALNQFPFGKLALDSRTGEAVGTYTEKEFYPDKRVPALASVPQMLSSYLSTRPSMTIVSASVSSKSGIAIFSLQDLAGKRALLKIADGRRDELQCQKEPSSLYQAVFGPPPIYQLDVINLGSAEWPLWAHRYSGEGTRKGLIVFMHGGPGSVAVGDTSRPTIVNYLGLGFDVLIPEYSGTIGTSPQVTVRLAKLGGDAIEHDAQLINGYLREQSKKNYPKIVLHGESFGAVFLLADALFKPKVFDQAIFLVPYLKYRDPREWLRQGPSSSSSVEYQRLSEQVLMGVGRGKPAALDRWLARPSRVERPTALFVYASNDGVVAPSDKPDLNYAMGSRTVMINSIHMAATVEGDTWSAVADFLGSAKKNSK
jgi:pimeloyl-ACP methyl ester carboxylesterase